MIPAEAAPPTLVPAQAQGLIESAAELLPAFLEVWGERAVDLRRAAVLVPLWRWWLRVALASLMGTPEASNASDTTLQESCRAWALQRWEPALEREFMARQERYHLLRYSQLRLADKDLAHELGFQLREKEADFPELNFRYGQAPERKRGGLMPDLPVSAIPKAIAGVLKGLRPGQVVGPLRLGQELLLLRLEASTPAVLDQTMRERLLQDLLEEWMAQGDAALLAALDSSADALLAEAG